MTSDKYSDPWATGTIVATCILFVVALAVKGISKDLLLEAGVFMVSVKLILMARKNAETEHRLEQQLEEIKQLLARKDAQAPQ